MSVTRLRFELEDEFNYTIQNDKDEFIGSLEKLRVGAWMTWCLFLEFECYLSAGCLDEVREKIRELNASSSKARDVSEVDNG